MPEIQSPAPVRNVDAPERVWKAGEHERAILGQRLLDQSMHQTYEIFARSFAAEWNNGSNERGKRKKKKPDTGPRLINSISEIAHIPGKICEMETRHYLFFAPMRDEVKCITPESFFLL